MLACSLCKKDDKPIFIEDSTSYCDECYKAWSMHKLLGVVYNVACNAAANMNVFEDYCSTCSIEHAGKSLWQKLINDTRSEARIININKAAVCELHLIGKSRVNVAYQRLVEFEKTLPWK